MNSPDCISGAGGIDANSAPHAYQFFAQDFFAAYTNHKGRSKPFSVARLFLLGRSIELAAKAIHLHGTPPKDVVFELSHDLIKACDPEFLSGKGIHLDENETKALEKMNAYYKDKGFEYFLYASKPYPKDTERFRTGAAKALAGWPDLPDENVLEGVYEKLLRYLS